MKNCNYLFIPFLLLFAAAALRGQTNRFAMPLVAGSLNLENVEIANKIPQSHLSRLPATAVVFKYSSKPRSLPLNALQALLDETVFRGTNLSNYLPASTNSIQPAFGVRLADGNNNYFIISPQQDHVLIGNVERHPATPPPDAVPSFDVVEKRLMQLVDQFGINTNELELGENGAIRVQKADANTTRLGGAVRFVSERSAKVFRRLGGRTTWLLNDDVSLRLGIDGQLLQFQLK